jgi:hypothetical protein
VSADSSAFGPVAPRDLAEARLQLHHAALLVSAVGRGLAKKQKGYRQAALTWDDDRRALVGAGVETPDGSMLRAALTMDPPGLS